MIVPVLDVKNVAESIKFYTEKLGFMIDMSLDGADGEAAFAGISLGKATFMLSRQEIPLEQVGNGVVFMLYLAEETDIDEFYANVQAKGLEIFKEIKTEYWGDRVFSIKDPDGYYITISKTIEVADMEVVGKVMRGEVEA